MALTCFECGEVIKKKYAILMFLGHTSVRFVPVEHARIRIILCDGHALGAYAHDVSHFSQPNVDTVGFALVPGRYWSWWRSHYRKADTKRMLETYRMHETRYVSERAPELFRHTFSRLTEFLSQHSAEHPDFHAGMARFLERRQSVALCKTELLSDKSA